MKREDEIRRIARECATEAAQAVSPQDRTPEILPEEPLPGDWEYLRDHVGKTTVEEDRIFSKAWCEQLEKEMT